MNPNVNEPSAGDYVKAAVLITGCAASIAIGFSLIAVCYAAKRLNPFARK